MKIYDSKEVQIVIAGVPITGGYTDGDFLRIEFNADAFTLKMGADGKGTRSKSNNRSASITLTLMQSSDDNDALSALHNLDLNSPGGAGIGPFICKDGSGRALYFAEKCWVKKSPTVTFGPEAGPREWVIETDNLVANDAGN